MNVIIYKDLSDAYDLINIEEGIPLRESLMGFVPLDENTLIIVNGKRVTPSYEPEKSDKIIIRRLPSEPITMLIVGIIMSVISIGVGVGVGLYTAGMKKDLDALKEKMESMGEGINNLPTMRGASNTIATGKSQPYIIGRRLFTPYLLAPSFRTLGGTDGKDEYYHLVLQAGFGKQIIKELIGDDLSLRTFTETEPQNGVYSFNNNLFPGGQIEIIQEGQEFQTLTALNKKIVTQKTNAEIKKADDDNYTDLFFTLEQYSMAVDVSIMFNGLIAFDSEDGSELNRTVRIIPSYSLDNGSTWQTFSFNQNGTPSNTFTRKKREQIRFTAHRNFTHAEVKDLGHPVQIRISCPTNKYDGSAHDACYVLNVMSTVYNPDLSETTLVPEKIIDDTERALSTIVGLKVKATVSNQDKINKIALITSGVARTWDGSAWSAAKVETSNPSSWLLEVLTSETHTASKLHDQFIDLESFGELYDYCEDEGLKIDTVLLRGTTKNNVIKSILSVCYSVLYKNPFGKIAVATDKLKTNAIAILNTQNLINFSFERTMSRLTDGIKVTYVADNDFLEDTYLVMRDGETRTPESTIEDIKVDNITSYEQIVKYARRVLAVEKLRPHKITCEVGKEGIFFTPYSLIYLQHPGLHIGLGSSEIESTILTGNTITGLVLRSPIQWDPGNSYGLIVNVGLSKQYNSEYTASESGLQNIITLTDPIWEHEDNAPKPGDILSYGYLTDSGEFDNITDKYLITGISPTEKGTKLTLVDYDERIYQTGTIPDYRPNLTAPKSIPVNNIPEEPAENDDIAIINGQLNNLFKTALTASVSDASLLDMPFASDISFYEENKILYVNIDDHNYIYKKDIRESGPGIKLNNVSSACPVKINDNFIAYINQEDGSTIYRKPISEENTGDKIFNSPCIKLSFYEGDLYFINYTDDNKLYKIDLAAGTNEEKVLDESIRLLVGDGDRLLAVNNNDSTVYQIVNGSANINLLTSQTIYDICFFKDDKFCYVNAQGEVWQKLINPDSTIAPGDLLFDGISRIYGYKNNLILSSSVNGALYGVLELDLRELNLKPENYIIEIIGSIVTGSRYIKNIDPAEINVLVPRDQISGDGIQAGSKITAVGNNYLIMDKGATLTSSEESLKVFGTRLMIDANKVIIPGTVEARHLAASAISSKAVDSNNNKISEINLDTGKQVFRSADGTEKLILDPANGIFEFAGDLKAATGTFAGELNAATGTFAGELNAASGSFKGHIEAESGNFKGHLKTDAIETYPNSGSAIIFTATELNNQRQAYNFYYDLEGVIGDGGYSKASVNHLSNVRFVRKTLIDYIVPYEGHCDRYSIILFDSDYALVTSAYTLTKHDSSILVGGHGFGQTTTINILSGGDVLLLKDLPTSPSGLVPNQVYVDGGVLKIV